MDREPRFYAWITYDGADIGPKLNAGKSFRVDLRDSEKSGYNPTDAVRDQCQTGYLVNKWFSPRTNWTASSQELKGNLWPYIRMAELYLNLGNYMGNNYESAVITAREAIKSYPFSEYLEEYQITILRARFEYAKNSTLRAQPERYRMVVDEYFNYKNSFPEGKYMAEAERYNREAQSKIDELPTT